MTQRTASKEAPCARLDAVRCPRCGGVPDPKGGPGHLARCSSCGVLGRIDDPDGGQRRYVVHAAVDAEFAARSVREALEGKSNVHARDEAFRLLGSELLYVPFWRITTVLVGRVEGTRERREKTLEKVTLDNGQTFYAWKVRDCGVERVDRELEKVHVTLVTGCPLDELGLPTLGRHRQTGLDLPLHQPLESLGTVSLFDSAVRDGAEVLDPLVGRPQAEREAAALVEAYRSGLGSGMTGVANVETAVLDRSVLLVFYPLYHVRFTHGGRHGSAIVDAVRGVVASLDVPADPSSTLARRTRALAALGIAFVLGALARAALPFVEAALPASASWTLAGLASGAFALYGWLARDSSGSGRAT